MLAPLTARGGSVSVEYDDAVTEIAHDIPCVTCRYDLRGLQADGRCPECGNAVTVSVNAWNIRRGALPPVRMEWLRQIESGTWLVLASFALMAVTAACVPSYVEWYRLPHRGADLSKTPGRVLLLSLACVWWVLSIWSASKLAAVEQFPECPRQRSLIAFGTRWLNAIYVLGPFSWALATWNDDYPRDLPWVWVGALAILSGWVGCLFFMLRVRQIALRLRMFAVPAEASVLAIATPCVAGLTMLPTGRGGGTTSLTFMFTIPTFPFGGASAIRSALRHVTDWFDSGIELLVVVAPLWTLSVLIRLAVRCRAVRVRRVKAVIDERTPASSLP
jgi:hypothetical protein